MMLTLTLWLIVVLAGGLLLAKAAGDWPWHGGDS